MMKVYKNTLNFDIVDDNEGKMSNCNVQYGKTKNSNSSFKEL
jgi:hypothetical protein